MGAHVNRGARNIGNLDLLMDVPPSSLRMQGAVILGKYRVLRQIGRGGMGIVVEAEHIDLRERVAIKFMKADASPGNAVPRFLREARAAARIRSEHVVRVIDVGRLEDERPFMVMEYLEGRDLAQKLAEDGPFPLADALGCILQACLGLAEAHAEGILHRDLKPSNLLLSRRSDGSSLIKILDFGVSKMDGATDLTNVRQVLGSLLYMSPEQLECSREVDQRTDIYSLGATLYELLSGHTPFASSNPIALSVKILKATRRPIVDFRPDLPAEFCAVLDKMLEKARDDRFAYVADAASALLPFAPPGAAALVERINRIPRRATRIMREETDDDDDSEGEARSVDPLGGTLVALHPKRPVTGLPSGPPQGFSAPAPSSAPPVRASPAPPRVDSVPRLVDLMAAERPSIRAVTLDAPADLSPFDDSFEDVQVIHDLRKLLSSRAGQERAKPAKSTDTDTWVQPLAKLGLAEADREALRAKLGESVSISIDTKAFFDLSTAASFGEGNAILTALCARLLADAATSRPGIGARAERLQRILATGAAAEERAGGATARSSSAAPAFGLLEDLYAETGDPVTAAILAVVLWQAPSRGGANKERALSLASESTTALPDDPLLLYCHGVMAFGLDRRTEAASVLARALEVGLEGDEAVHASFLLDDLINFGYDGTATQADDPG
ncbi:MAG: serine/threonine-protein kinase [Polyangiaceae bacterium]